MREATREERMRYYAAIMERLEQDPSQDLDRVLAALVLEDMKQTGFRQRSKTCTAS